MDMQMYQQQALRTSPDDHDRILNGCLGLMGECGEIVDIVKKFFFQSCTGTILPEDKLIEEMGDVLWYISEVTSGLGDRLDVTVTRRPQHSLYRFFAQDFDLDLEKTAALMIIFAGNAYRAAYFEDNVSMLRGSVFDVFCALNRMCMLLNTSPEHCADVNIEKLKKRYPDGFDPVRSMNRPEYSQESSRVSEADFLFTARNKTI